MVALEENIEKFEAQNGRIKINTEQPGFPIELWRTNSTGLGEKALE
jgi:ABC-type glycerol-3-phosphate transport system substrate-binding protein